MKNYLIFTFLFFSCLAYSQKDMSIDIIGSFDYIGITENDLLFTNGQGVNDPFTGIKGIYTYRVGANFNFRIFEKVMFKTGIRYANVGDNFFMDDLRWPSEIGPNGFEPDPTLPRYINLITKHRYIEIPLIVRYEIANKKFSPFVEFGLSPHLYVNTKTINKTNFTSSSVVRDYSELADGFNKLQLAAVLSVGANYNANKTIQVFAQTTLRYNINRLTENENSLRYYSVGLEFGVRKMFGSYFDEEKS